MKKNNLLLWIGIGVIILLFIGIIVWDRNRPGEYDAFAQCLAEKGAKYYGAFWCPNCKRQTEEFGRSSRLLPYIECSTPDGQGQKNVCKERGVEGYPTWVFADGSRVVGVQPWSILAEKTGCALPQ